VTREQALQVLNNFIAQRLPTFGPYQDAMVTGEETMWHSLISPYLNIGLLHPLEVIQAAEIACGEHDLDLNSVEGFIRQILGWREYIRGVYFYVDADYFQKNWFNHTRPLPEFFWDASKTDLNCLHQVLTQVESSGYAHHIQRLLTLSGLKPLRFCGQSRVGQYPESNSRCGSQTPPTQSVKFLHLTYWLLFLEYWQNHLSLHLPPCHQSERYNPRFILFPDAFHPGGFSP
jgi:Uncharacterized protein related to deoxyribodipyrimidine photolyase